MQGQVLAIVLDGGLRTWGTREDLHLMFARALIQKGVRPIFVFSDAPVEELKTRFRAEGAEVTSMNYEEMGRLRFHRALGDMIRQHKVTGIHIAFFNYFSPLPWMARLHGVRQIVYHERNPGVLKATGWKRQLLRMRTKIMAAPMTWVIAISDFIKRQLIDLGIAADKVTRVHHGVDLRIYHPDPSARERLNSQYQVGPNEIVMAALSYVKPHKNIDIILDACSQLQKRGILFRFFMIGEGEMRAELEALAHRLGIANRVHWLGHIPDPVPVLQASDIFLMMSRGEGFGLALAEGMACGAASIASDSGAHPEIIEDGKNGLLVPLRDPTALADAIQKIAQNPQLRKQIAQNGVERVRNTFNAETSIAKLVQVYESIWNGNLKQTAPAISSD